VINMDKFEFTMLGGLMMIIVAMISVSNMGLKTNLHDVVTQSLISGGVIGYSICWIMMITIIHFKTKWVDEYE